MAPATRQFITGALWVAFSAVLYTNFPNISEMTYHMALERQDDGSAVYPELMRDIMRENRTILKEISKEHPEWIEIIEGDDIEAFQKMLRQDADELKSKRQALEEARAEKEAKTAKKIRRCLQKGKKSPEECEAIAAKEAAKGQPQLHRMKMMGPHPTEDDQYNRQAPEVPTHMRCDACQAVVYQGSKAVAAALASRKRDDKVSIVTIEALETLCYNMTLWMYEYGYAPGPNGENLFIGAGVHTSEHWDEEGDLVVPQTSHSDGIGRRLSSACAAVLLGASAPDEDEIANIAIDYQDADGAAAALRAIACEQPGQPCAARAA
jgi:hypothetical protein